jgi:transposase
MGSRVELSCSHGSVEGLSIRELARRHGVGRPTVRLALSQAEPLSRKTRVRTAPRLDVSKSVIDEILRQDLDAPRKQRHTARRVFAHLADEHAATELSYSTVRNYVRRRQSEPATGRRSSRDRFGRASCRRREPARTLE